MKHNVLFNRPTIKGWELRQGCESFAHSVCSALGLKPVIVTWDSSIQTAAINRLGQLYLSAVRDDATITRPTLMRYAGFVVHELLHRKYTRHCKKSAVAKPYLRQLHNALEDAWIEHNAIDSGLLGNVEGLLRELLEQMISEAEAAVSNWADPAQYPFLLAVWCRRHARNIPLPQGLQPIFDEAAQRVLDCQSTQDTYALAEWVEQQLRLNLPKQKKGQQQGQDRQQDKQGQGKQGQKGAPGNSPQDASDRPQSADHGEGKGEGADQKKTPQKAYAPAADCEPAEVEPTLEAPDNAAAHGSFCREVQVKVAQPKTGHAIWGVKPVPAKLRYEVRKLFENTASTDFSPNRKSGAVNTRALHKLGVSDALFQLRRDQDGIDSAVVLVIDTSSSMDQEGKMGHAVSAAAALLDTLNSAGVATAVVSFDDTVYINAGFEARVQFKRDQILRLGPWGSTNDHAAIKAAHDLLRVRPEARKVCFVLTDGDGDRRSAKEQADSGEALGITTIGIGIKHDVSRVYRHNVQVNDLADLGTVVFSQIKLAA